MGASDTEPVDEVEQLTVLPPLKERADAAVLVVHQLHGYWSDDKPDRGLVEDKVFEFVSKAEVQKRADRGKLAITRSSLLAQVFPKVAGPDEWDEQDDPEVAEELHKRLDGMLWRMCNSDASGKIQARLNSDSGLILCRTKATPDSVDAVYVTSDLACLIADFSGPHKDRLKREADRFATNLSMAVDRLPQHAARFKRELSSGMKTALGSGEAILVPSVEAASADTPQVDEDVVQ